MKTLPLLLTFILLISCGIQKRKYQKGFYVYRPHHAAQLTKAPPQVSGSIVERKLTEVPNPIRNITGDREQFAGLGPLSTSTKHRSTFAWMVTPPDSCDVLLFKDGSELRAKVFEVGTHDVKYKRCDNLLGPNYVTRKEDLFMIKYTNGSKEVMKTEPVASKEVPHADHSKFIPAKDKTMQPLAPIALGFGTLGILFSLIFTSLFSNYTSSGYQGLFFLFLAAIVSAILALTLGGAAHRKIKMEPDVYKGKGLAIPGKILGIVTLGYWAFLIIMLLILLLFLI